MGVMESAEIRLETPLGARTVVDGANTWPGRALAPKCCAYEYGDPVEIDDSEETRRMGIAGCRGQVVGVRTDEESDEVFAYEVRIEGRPEVCVLSTEDVGHFRE